MEYICDFRYESKEVTINLWKLGEEGGKGIKKSFNKKGYLVAIYLVNTFQCQL